VNRGERRALWHYRLRGYRILGTNVVAGRNELDLIVRRGKELTFVEVKERQGTGFGGALGAVDREKQRRVRTAARIWLSRNPQRPEIRVGFEVVAVEGGRLERRETTMDDRVGADGQWYEAGGSY
jgi:putative endonuclease